MRYVAKRKIISIPQGTFKPNYTVVGSPTVSNGVVSGFSASNYLFLPPALDVSGGKTWEAVVKLHTGTFTTNEYQVILRGSVECTGFVLQTNGNVFSIFASSNGTSMDIASNVRSTLTLDNDTTYWVKASFNGSQYLVDVSTDNQSWINYVTIASTLSVYTGDYVIGCNIPAFYTRAPFQGSIDLNESYIKINGEYWWNCKYNENVTDTISYVAKRKNRRYYKEHIIEWTKPTLSTNPQNGYSLSGTSYGGDIKLISNNLDGGSGYIEVQTTAAYGCLLQYDFPCVVELTNVGVNYLDQYRVNNGFSSFKLVAVLNGIETVISTETPARMNAWYTKNYPINNIRATSIRVYCSCPSAPWLRIGELYITGRQIDTVEVSASDDYDYYEDTVKSYAVKRKTRRYYKYVSQSWTQPTLTANAYSAIQEVSVSDDWDYYVDDIKSYVIGRK